MNFWPFLIPSEIEELSELRQHRLIELLNEDRIKIATHIPDLWTEKKILGTKLEICKRDLLDRITDPLDERQAEKRLEETMVAILTKQEYDIDPNEHVIAVFDKAIDHLIHLDRDKFKEKLKDIRKKTKRVIHQIESGKTKEELLKLEEEVRNYFERFEEFWSKRRKKSSVSVTAEETLTEGVF